MFALTVSQCAFIPKHQFLCVFGFISVLNTFWPSFDRCQCAAFGETPLELRDPFQDRQVSILPQSVRDDCVFERTKVNVNRLFTNNATTVPAY